MVVFVKAGALLATLLILTLRRSWHHLRIVGLLSGVRDDLDPGTLIDAGRKRCLLAVQLLPTPYDIVTVTNLLLQVVLLTAA